MDTNQLSEFIGNNLMLVLALAAIIALLIANELKQRLGGVKEVGPSQATRMLNHENAIMIDMRSDKDYKEGHIINALHLQPDQDNNKKLDKYRDRPLIVYCHSGNKSTALCGKLHKQGFESVYYLKGGVTAWTKAELPLTKAG